MGCWGHSSASSEIRKRPQDELFAAMKRWVKEDIFTKDFLLIPMNERCGALDDGLCGKAFLHIDFFDKYPRKF